MSALTHQQRKTSGILMADGTRTYSVFLNSNTRVFLDATNKRAEVQFVDELGDIRGSTSVAVEGGGPSARTFFDEAVVNQVLQNTCTECHQVGGTAESTGLVFAQDFEPGYVDTNFAALTTYLNAEPDAATVLVANATGEVAAHPAILAADSPEAASVLTFLDLFATE